LASRPFFGLGLEDAGLGFEGCGLGLKISGLGLGLRLATAIWDLKRLLHVK